MNKIKFSRSAIVICWTVFLVFYFAGFVQGRVKIPDTPAGNVLKEMLEAYNSLDIKAVEAYYKKHQPEVSAASMMPFLQQTGGFDLLSIEQSEPLSITVKVKERNSNTQAYAKFILDSAGSARVINSSFNAVPTGATWVGYDIDAETRDKVIDGVISKLKQFYVFVDTADEMAKALVERKDNGEYNSINDGTVFANLITQHLRAVSNDLHLGLRFNPAKAPNMMSQAPDPEDLKRFQTQMKANNCAFEKVEHLAGNIGYLKFNGFMDDQVCGPTASAAMGFLKNVDALIIDLRQNGGGAPKMVAYISSYLFSGRTHLNDLYTRFTDKTEEYWTLDDIPGERLADIPVYLLTSKRTFSGAEEFTYNLKNLKRATIVGEVTGGGAHPTRGEPIDDRFVISVPFARAINPVSKTNWEGTGVEPDVKVSADEALETALKLARESLAK